MDTRVWVPGGGRPDFLHLRGEFSGLRDTGSLDGVVMAAVPELPSAALALAGLALLALRGRRRD